MIWFFAALGFLTQPVSPWLTIPSCCHENEIKVSKGCYPSGYNLTADFDGRPYEFSHKPCNSSSVPIKISEVILRNDSSLQYISEETIIENYCFAFVNLSGVIELKPMVCVGDDYLELYDESDIGETYETALLNNIGLIIGVPFLIVTCCVYSVLRVFKNIYGKCVKYSSFAFSMSYIVLLVVRLFSDKYFFPDYLCIGFAVDIAFIILIVGTGALKVPKCCPDGKGVEIGHDGNCRCLPSNDTRLRPFKPWKNASTYHRPFQCDPSNISLLEPEEFTITDNGSLILDDDPKFYDDYCFELNLSENNTYAFLCVSEDEENDGPIIVYPVGMLISLPFLIMTLLTYILLPTLHNKHGYCLIAHVFSMIASYSTLSIVQIYTNMPLIFCLTFGFAVQFFFLATFFWLNVMCIDIYWAFSGFKLRGSASERDRKKLLAYSIYAWGMPLIILAVTVGVDYYDAIPATSSFKPNMGKDKCFFKSRTATWTYFYGPMAVILFSNLILFAVTAFRIWRHRRETAVLQRGDSRRHDGNESERFNLYLKLFLVMGINWISELVSFMFGKDVPQYLWYITDITNTLQGVFIFLIFVWKKRVRKLLWDKFKKKQVNVNGSTMTASTAINGSMR